MNECFIEAESFDKKGGWVVDQQSMETIHSSYLMAHGMGIPVEDAQTVLKVTEGGVYNVYALTRDWTKVWDVKDSAGKFSIFINGTELENVLGTKTKEWAWQFAGKCRLKSGDNVIALHDYTGFNGRCDAVYITQSLVPPKNDLTSIDNMRKELNYKTVKEYDDDFDFVVVGGGIAGLCTALAATYKGVKTCLISDRGVLGGCNSSEVRVCMGGGVGFEPYPQIGNIVRAISPMHCYPGTYEKECFEDARKYYAVLNTIPSGFKCKLMLNKAVTDVNTENGKVVSVICTDTLTGHKTLIKGNLFSDCSGDGVVARKAGCEVMYGREARSEFGETLAPEEHQNMVMGHSIRWVSEKMNTPCDFPEIDWNLDFDDASCLNCYSGDWEQECGFRKNMVTDIEYIRDFGLRAIYSNWAYQKHKFIDKDKFKNHKLKWVSYLGGRRESYRVKGDVILTQRDIEERRYFDDATACLTWSIDMHFPEPTNEEKFGEAFRSFAYHRGIVSPYPVPYRCLYAKDIDNLFLGGRIVSASHVAFSSVRVMRTLGALGEVVGIAAELCKSFNCSPGEIYKNHLTKLKSELKKGVTLPLAFACGTGSEEQYHFKDIGWLSINENGYSISPDKKENLPKFKKGIKKLGLMHKYPIPDDLK